MVDSNTLAQVKQLRRPYRNLIPGFLQNLIPGLPTNGRPTIARELSDLEVVFAGLCAGAATEVLKTALLHPVDTIKVSQELITTRP